MAILVLLRHAKAVRNHEAPNDFARGLTDGGRADASAAAQALARAGLAPSVAVVSPARRTEETWECAAAVWSPTPPVVWDDRLYEAPSERIWEAAIPHLSHAPVVAVIGHNPGLCDLALALARQSGASRDIDGLPTAAWAAFDLDERGRASATLGFWRPGLP